MTSPSPRYFFLPGAGGGGEQEIATFASELENPFHFEMLCYPGWQRCVEVDFSADGLIAELTAEVEEHDRSNTDLRNLFASSQLATVFLDRHLRIRSFTPAVTAIFNLLPADRGRLLTDFATTIDGIDLKGEIAEVLEDSVPREHSITRNGQPPHYLMRLLPYRTSEGAVDGVLGIPDRGYRYHCRGYYNRYGHFRCYR